MTGTMQKVKGTYGFIKQDAPGCSTIIVIIVIIIIIVIIVIIIIIVIMYKLLFFISSIHTCVTLSFRDFRRCHPRYGHVHSCGTKTWTFIRVRFAISAAAIDGYYDSTVALILYANLCRP